VSDDETTKPAEQETPPAAPPVNVDLDLDAIERDGNRPGPFVFRLKGQVFQLIDPRDIDWQDLLVAQRNPLMFVKFALGDADYKRFLQLSVPEWQMEKLMAGFFKHFGMADSPEARALLRL
jgi:hypothetical protein